MLGFTKFHSTHNMEVSIITAIVCFHLFYLVLT